MTLLALCAITPITSLARLMLRITDKPKSHIYSDRIWYLKLYHFTIFMHFLVQLVDLVWILHKVRDTAMVSLILGLLEHFGNIWMKME
jgi:hypothetical protein